MSVGVCILNREGIGLAADSAVTIGNGEMYYNHSKKLLRVSEKHALGVITFESASFFNISPEQIIGEFRKYLDGDNAPEIRHFSDVVPIFRKFLESHAGYFRFDSSSAANTKKTIDGLLLSVRDLITNENNEISPYIRVKDVREAIQNNIDVYKIIKDDCFVLECFDKTEYFIREFRDYFNERVHKILPELSGHSYEKLFGRFFRDVCEYFNRSYSGSRLDYDMRFCFAGYGDDEIFPSYQEIALKNIIDGEVKAYEDTVETVSGCNAIINPLAQNDVILTFDRGISDDCREIFFEHYSRINDEITQKYEKHLTPDQIVDLRRRYNEYIEGFNIDVLQKEIQSRNIQPLINSVRVLDPFSLSKLAGSLVDMTTAKRTYCLDDSQQTVGGETDSAFITKTDGFVWVRKKDRTE